MGWEKYQAKCAEIGIILTEAEARAAIATFRKGNQLTVEFWGKLDKDLRMGILSPDKSLEIEMPTGEKLKYHHLRQIDQD
jgi:hypothetical protein